ncbi:MAG: hypothetical protein GTO12_13125 [Proteobacteria bacterium]|nr:hypothetical protein [Pseudomonadota bacterium]
MGRFRVGVEEQCSAIQVDIDLEALNLPFSKHFESEQRNRFLVNPRGYTVFHVSNGAGGYAVVLKRSDGKGEVTVFDSRELNKGDLFAVTLLRPGTYSVTNVNTKAQGEIVVAYPTIGKVPYRPPEPVSIQCTENALKPNKVNLKPAQGHVYRFETPSRIRIELVKPDDGPKALRKSPSRKKARAS